MGARAVRVVPRLPEVWCRRGLRRLGGVGGREVTRPARGFQWLILEKTRPATGHLGPPAKKLAQQAQKRQTWGVFSTLGELFRARTYIKPRRANFFAHKTQRRGGNATTATTADTDAGGRETTITTARPRTATIETNNTSASEKRTKNAHFSPAKATPVSTPHGHQRAKATPVSTPHGHQRAKATLVSNNHTPGVRTPTPPPAGIYAPAPPENSHVIRLGEVST